MFGVRFVIGVRVTDEWWYDQSQALATGLFLSIIYGI